MLRQHSVNTSIEFTPTGSNKSLSHYEAQWTEHGSGEAKPKQAFGETADTPWNDAFIDELRRGLIVCKVNFFIFT
jgi:hypothetical protein